MGDPAGNMGSRFRSGDGSGRSTFDTGHIRSRDGLSGVLAFGGSTTATDPGGRGRRGGVAYTDKTNYNVEVAHCTDATCSTLFRKLVDEFETQGANGDAITIGPDGLP